MPFTGLSSYAPSARAALCMVFASIFIALSTFLAKGASGHFSSPDLAVGMHPLQVTAGRFIFAWLAILVIFIIKRPPMTKIHWRLHCGRSVFGWMTVASVFWASSLMALSDATAISFLTPVVTLVLAVTILGERVGWIRWSAVGIMLVGALVLLRPGTSAFQPAALIALLAAFTSAIEVTFVKKIVSLEPRLQILMINNSLGLVIAVAAAIMVWVSLEPLQWLVLCGVGLSMLCAQVFFLTSMNSADASYVIPFMYSTLIFASILDFMVFGELPDTLGAVGAAIIVCGAIFLALREETVKKRQSV